MPTVKEETFSFGGVDSRSNPANYPPNRAIRCLNWTPQQSGALRLRDGYSVPTGPTADSRPIHSAIYYEQFASSYLGPQFIVYGKADQVDILNLATGQVNLAPNGKAFPNPSSLVASDAGAGGTLAAGTYYYVVTELDGQGGETSKSNETSITIGLHHVVHLTWTGTGGGSGYNVYRSLTSGGETILVGAGLPVGVNIFSDDGSAAAAASVTITTITAVGGGSPLANVLLATPSTDQFQVGQQITIQSDDNDLFNTIATITAIVDASNLTVSATAFTSAGIGGIVDTSQGPVSPATLSQIGADGQTWSLGGGSASVTLIIAPGEYFSKQLQILGPSLMIPSGATIKGIEVSVSKEAQFTEEIGGREIDDNGVFILKSGSIAGIDHSAVGEWPYASAPTVYGGPSDLWGASWVPADFSDPNFGLFMSASMFGDEGQSDVGLISSATFKVYYRTTSTVSLIGNGGTIALSGTAPPPFNTTHLNLANQMGSANPWGHFRSKNRLFISSGALWLGRFFNSDQVNWDGINLRPSGLPGLSVFSNATGGPVVVSVTSSSLGSIAPTELSGYQIYGAIYNPITQHMGNRFALGDRFTVGTTTSALVLTGLPNPYFVGAFADPYSEWLLAVGMTNDGGEVPYWMIDASGNNIVLGNSATMGTVYIGNVNALQELPVRNDLPLPMDKFARVGTRIFGARAGDPFLKYSNDVADVSNADYVGNPEESWPGDQQEPLPDGNLPTSIHAYRLEGWFFSRENLCIWSQFLLQQGVNPWRGPWPGGCAGQRAFIETPHGPFWVSAQKQLCTFMEDGVISVSGEYELALLGQIGDQYLGETEVSYLLDQQALNDIIVIRGRDNNGNAVIIVHDFSLNDERSSSGQGYQYQYTGMSTRTFVGAGYTPRQNVYDTSGHMRLWAGSNEGFFAQLETGYTDNGSTISGDYVTLIGLGTKRRSLAELEYQGDPNIQFSYCPDYSLTIDDFIPIVQDEIPDDVQTSTRFGAKMSDEEARWVYIRMQLDSHPDDGSYALSSPPFLPMPWYGAINETVLKLGAERPQAR